MGCGDTGGKVTPGRDFHDEVSFGHLSQFSKVNKFGRNPIVGNAAYEVVSISGLYPTPTSPVSLEFISGDAADAVDDVGMHSLTIIGLDANWAEQTTTVAAHATDGTNAVAVPGTWFRVYRAYVASSGTYASVSAGSHVGTITIRVAGAGGTYCVIDATSFPRGQSETGAYTVPLGKTALVHQTRISVSGVTVNKVTNVIFFQRALANDVTTPFTGVMREVTSYTGLLNGQYSRDPAFPLGPFIGPCDLGFLAIVSGGTGEIEAEFDMILEDTHA